MKANFSLNVLNDIKNLKDAAVEIDNLNDCFSDRSVAVQNIIIILIANILTETQF